MTSDVVGGVWTYALDLARALRPRGVDVALAVLGGELSEDRRRAAEEVCESVHARPYRLVWMRDPWEDVRAARTWISELVAELRPDVAHVNDYGVVGGTEGVPTLLVGHSCVLSWWAAVRGEPAPSAWDPYKKVVRLALSRASLVVAPTEAMRASLGHHYGHLTDARVVYNGVDPNLFRDIAEEPYVATVGRLWDEAKDVATLARAAEHVPWPVVAVGETRGPDQDGDGPPLQGVRALGALPREAVAEKLGRAAIYAHPARYEPFGIAPLEAALSGCALVLSDLPTLREVWGDAALYFPPGDAGALAAEIRALVEDVDSRRAAASAARDRAGRYTIERAAAAYHGLYDELAGHPSEPRSPSPGGHTP